MKKLLSLLLVFTLCFATGCAAPKQDNTDEPVSITHTERFEVDDETSFEVLQSATDPLKFYPTLKGSFSSNYLPDKVTITCAGEEKNIKYTVESTKEGFKLNFNQIINYYALAKYDYPVQFHVYKNGWKKELASDVSLNCPDYYTYMYDQGYSGYMGYMEEWTSNLYNGLSIKATGSTITVNGSKTGGSQTTFAVQPFVLTPGTYDFMFECVSGDFTTATGLRFGLKIAGVDASMSLPAIMEVGDIGRITYVIAETVTIREFYIMLSDDRSNFNDTVIEYRYV